MCVLCDARVSDPHLRRTGHRYIATSSTPTSSSSPPPPPPFASVVDTIPCTAIIFSCFFPFSLPSYLFLLFCLLFRFRPDGHLFVLSYFFLSFLTVHGNVVNLDLVLFCFSSDLYIYTYNVYIMYIPYSTTFSIRIRFSTKVSLALFSLFGLVSNIRQTSKKIESNCYENS